MKWEWKCPACGVLFIRDDLQEVQQWRERHAERCLQSLWTRALQKGLGEDEGQ
jgi:hypothetical protein